MGLDSFNITLLVLTSIGPGFSGREISGWRVDNSTLTWDGESEVEVAVSVSVAMMLERA